MKNPVINVEASYSYLTLGGKCFEGAIVYGASLNHNPTAAEVILHAKDQIFNLWGLPNEDDALVLNANFDDKHIPKWTHMIWATGPVTEDSDDDGTELFIIWFSEMSPDTDRVLDAIDWNKNAKGYKSE
jgi:hypothetical protein